MVKEPPQSSPNDLLNSKSDKWTFYIASKTFGGEYIWLERISKKIGGSNIVFIWNRGDSEPSVEIPGLRNNLLISLAKILPFGRELFINILIAYLRLPDTNPTFVSSSYYPIPVNTSIAYIHTPSRRMTVQPDSNVEYKGLKAFAWEAIKLAYRLTYCRSLSNAAKIYTNSQNTAERIQKFCPSCPHIEVVYPSQDITLFSFKRFENFFFMPSRFTEQKNQLFAIRAFKRFLEISESAGGTRPTFNLLLAGSDPAKGTGSVGYLEKLRDFINSHGDDLISKIQFVFDAEGPTLRDYYSRCFAVLYPARNEDFGQVPIEGMLSSKPVIALNEGGMKETIKEGETGFLVDTVEEMAEKMFFLANHAYEAQKMGMSGRHLAAAYDDELFLSRAGISR